MSVASPEPGGSMKGAVIGFGQVAEKAHAPAFHGIPQLSITAVVDGVAERRGAAENVFSGARSYPTVEAMLKAEPDLDFVDIASPPHLHAEQAAAALRAGLHVICEKPVALSMEEFETAAAAAAETGKAYFPVHNWKHAPLLQALKGLLERKVIGTVRHLEWHVLRTQPAKVAQKKGNWRTDPKLSGGGILMDHGWHAFYLVGWLLGQAPASVHGDVRCPKGSGRRAAETEATCLIRYPKSSAVVHLSWNSPRRGHWGIVYGQDGSIEVQDDRLLVVRKGQPPQGYAVGEALSAGSAHPEWFREMLGDFLTCVREPGRREGFLEEARQSLWLLERLYARRLPPRREKTKPVPAR